MKNELYKLEMIDAILKSIEIAQDMRTFDKNLILNFSVLVGLQEQLVFLQELKKEKIIADFKKGPDCFYIMGPSQEKLFKKRAGFAENKEDKIEPSKLSFDPNSSKILFGNKECKIPLNSNQYFLCKKMFSVPFGNKIKEIDILDMIDWVKDTKRSVYDAMRAINNKVYKEFDIKNLMNWRNNHIWIRENW